MIAWYTKVDEPTDRRLCRALLAFCTATLVAGCGGQIDRAAGDGGSGTRSDAAVGGGAYGDAEHDAGAAPEPPCTVSCPNCCGGPTCVDFETNANHCGTCGHSCLGGACSGGLCQPFTVASVPLAKMAAALTLDDNSVYYATTDGTLLSCPKTGCATNRVLTSGLQYPTAILYDAVSNDVIVADTNNEAIESFTTAGDLVFRDESLKLPSALAADATYIYAGVSDGILRATRDGQPPSLMAATLPAQVSALALDPASGTLYAAFANKAMPIWSMPASGAGSASPFAGTDKTLQDWPAQIVVRDLTVYWLDQGAPYGGIYSCPTTGCAAPTALDGMTSLYNATCFFLSSTDVYYLADQQFYRCPIGGCPGGGTRIAADLGTLATSLCAEDATSFYFISFQSVLRLAK